MKAGTAKILLQAELGIPEEQRSPHIGPKTRHAFELLAATPNEADWPPRAQASIPSTMSGRNINKRGLDLVKHFESLFTQAYKDEVGVWTIGYGHTGLVHNDGTVHPGRSVTPEEATALLDYDMNQSEAAVTALAGEQELTDDQFSALVSWHFNTGGPKSATLWTRLRAGRMEETANQFLLWDKAGGRTLRGLTRRRRSERNLFLGKEDYLIHEL